MDDLLSFLSTAELGVVTLVVAQALDRLVAECQRSAAHLHHRRAGGQPQDARGDPVGRNIRVKNISCEVIGLLEARGQSSMGTDQDDVVLLPLRAFHLWNAVQLAVP